MSHTALTRPVHPEGPHAGRCNAPDAFGISCDTVAWLEPAGGRAAHRQAARAALTRLEERYRDGALPFLSGLHSGPPTRGYLDVGKRFSRDAGLIVHCGCGGSLHAGRVFVAAAAGANSHPETTRPPVVFAESIDPDSCARLRKTLDQVGQEHVYSVIVSKSGHTTETLALFAMLLEWYGEALELDAIRKRAICLTEAGPSPLRALAQARGIPILEVPSDVGGRFAAFTVSGLLPAAIGANGSGPDEPDVLAGGRAVLARAFPREGLSAAAQSAAAMAAFHEHHGTGTLVTLAYTSTMEPLQTWYRQLVAESLGKDRRGFTPVTARGTDDEHSQLQLWLDGPPGQMFTLLRSGTARDGDVKLPVDLPGYPTWFPRRLGTLWHAHADATCASLAAAGRPVRTFTFARRSLAAYGALMAHLMLETVLVADLLGIDPFGQPAVEETKERIVQILTKEAR